MADCTLNSAFGLISSAFCFGLLVAKNLTGLFFDFAGYLLNASCDTILVHRQSLCLVSRSKNTRCRLVVPNVLNWLTAKGELRRHARLGSCGSSAAISGRPEVKESFFKVIGC